MSELVVEPIVEVKEPTVGPAVPAEPKTYTAPATQEDLDRIIEERLARERKKFTDYDDLRAKNAEYEKWKKSQLTEHEKAVKAARGVAEASTKYEMQIATAEIRTRATQAGFTDPDDALAMFGGELPIKDGEPDEATISARLEEIAKAKPYLLTVSPPTPPRGKPKLPLTEKRSAPEDGKKGRASAAMQ